MLNSKSKRVGFVGTVFFHIGLLIICFFSSIGYTSVDFPVGIEIEFIPYQEIKPVEKTHDNKNHTASNLSDINKEDIVEEVILQEEQTTTIPNQEDSVTLSVENKRDESLSISLELQNALSKINDSQLNDSIELIDLHDTNVEVSINNNTAIEHLQDGYTLSDNRFAVRKVKPKYACEEFGKVIVRVWVNQKGATIKAEAGIRGTTESASCLLKEAKQAAMQTTWTPYFDAPEVQIGQITYNFHKY